MTWNSGSTEIVAQRASGEASFERPLTERGSFGILQSWSCKLRKERVPHDPRGQRSGVAAQSHEAGRGDRERLGGLPAVRHLAHPVLPLAATLRDLRRSRAGAAADPAAALGTTVDTRVGARGAGLRAPVATHGPQRIADQLMRPNFGGWTVSASGTYAILARHGL